MPYQLRDRTGHLIRALIDIEDRHLILHSRGGSTGGRPERNPEYRLAFDAIFDRLHPQRNFIERVILDSRKARQSGGDTVLAEASDFARFELDDVKRQIRKKGRDFGRSPSATPNQGNSTKQLRFDVVLDKDELIRQLDAVLVDARGIAGAEASGDAAYDPENGAHNEPVVPPTEDDKSWAEGSPKRAAHLRRERKAGLAKLKKDAMLARHGYLFCERCGIVPIQELGVHGDAVIEVHHTIPVATMSDGHETKLDDLECLCANCHRIRHREIAQE